MAKFDGVKQMVGGTEVVVPGLALGALRRFAEAGTLALAQGGRMTPEEIGAQIEIIASALQRNHPETTPEWVSENVDTRSVLAILRAIFNASGMKVTAPGEAPSP